MKRIRMHRRLAKLLLACVLVSATSNALATTISTLTAGGTLTEGDEVFSNFSATCLPASCASSGLVLDVEGITDANGNIGIRFQWLSGDITPKADFGVSPPCVGLPACGPQGIVSDFSVTYTVSASTPDHSIVGAQLAGDPTFTYPDLGNFTVQETLNSVASPASPIDVYDECCDPVISPIHRTVDSTSSLFTAHPSLGVTTQISFAPTCCFSNQVIFGTLSFVDETFSEAAIPTGPPPNTVPEPSLLVLLVLNLCIVAFIRLHQRSVF